MKYWPGVYVIWELWEELVTLWVRSSRNAESSSSRSLQLARPQIHWIWRRVFMAALAPQFRETHQLLSCWDRVQISTADQINILHWNLLADRKYCKVVQSRPCVAFNRKAPAQALVMILSSTNPNWWRARRGRTGFQLGLISTETLISDLWWLCAVTHVDELRNWRILRMRRKAAELLQHRQQHQSVLVHWKKAWQRSFLQPLLCTIGSFICIRFQYWSYNSKPWVAEKYMSYVRRQLKSNAVWLATPQLYT